VWPVTTGGEPVSEACSRSAAMSAPCSTGDDPIAVPGQPTPGHIGHQHAPGLAVEGRPRGARPFAHRLPRALLPGTRGCHARKEHGREALRGGARGARRRGRARHGDGASSGSATRSLWNFGGRAPRGASNMSRCGAAPHAPCVCVVVPQRLTHPRSQSNREPIHWVQRRSPAADAPITDSTRESWRSRTRRAPIDGDLELADGAATSATPVTPSSACRASPIRP
jgi:hypothetical protein